MKVLQIVHGFPPDNTAGTEVYTYNLSSELAKRHNVFVFYRINDLNIKEYTLTHARLNGFRAFAINNTFRLYDSFKSTYKNKIIAQKLGLILDQVSPDIVHIQHLMYLGAELIKEIKKRSLPIVFTLHDYWLLCPQGQLLEFNLWLCNNKENETKCFQCIIYQLSIKKNVFIAYYLLKKYIPEVAFRLLKDIYLKCCKFTFLTESKAGPQIKERTSYIKYISSGVDLFIAPSQFLRQKFIEFGIAKNRTAYITYGFNFSNFKNLSKVYSAKLRFGFIGNLLPAKGVHILIQSFNNIRNQNVELKIYGQAVSYKSILTNYLGYIRKIARNKNIRFMGGFDNKDVAKVFAEIDILVVPSIWYENSPLIIQEAFAAQTPVIASRIGGIPELIDDGINGVLFEPNNPEDLYEKINLIIENPSLIEKIRQNIKPPKSIEENAKEMEEIYSKLIIGKNCDIYH